MIRLEVVQAYLAIGPSRLQFAMEVADIVLLGLLPSGDHIAGIACSRQACGNHGAVKPHQVLSRLGMCNSALSIG
jgi:hypothetical protein